jgi:hypothetical protein
MSIEQSVIKRIRDKAAPISHHMAQITGQRYVPKPYYYKNIETDEEYFTIAGALS